MRDVITLAGLQTWVSIDLETNADNITTAIAYKNISERGELVERVPATDGWLERVKVGSPWSEHNTGRFAIDFEDHSSIRGEFDAAPM